MMMVLGWELLDGLGWRGVSSERRPAPPCTRPACPVMGGGCRNGLTRVGLEVTQGNKQALQCNHPPHRDQGGPRRGGGGRLALPGVWLSFSVVSTGFSPTLNHYTRTDTHTQGHIVCKALHCIYLAVAPFVIISRRKRIVIDLGMLSVVPPEQRTLALALLLRIHKQHHHHLKEEKDTMCFVALTLVPCHRTFSPAPLFVPLQSADDDAGACPLLE